MLLVFNLHEQASVDDITVAFIFICKLSVCYALSPWTAGSSSSDSSVAGDAYYFVQRAMICSCIFFSFLSCLEKVPPFVFLLCHSPDEVLEIV